MAVWITFATEDNVDGDIDYLAQEIARTGLRTRMHPMFPGEDEKLDRLLTAFLGRSEQSDAWVFYASKSAVRDNRVATLSEALNRARAIRGDFPAVSLVADGTPLPSTNAIDITDQSWREQLSAVIGKGEAQEGGRLTPYVARMHPDLILEVRPKFGVWQPFLFAVLPEEKNAVAPSMQAGPRTQAPGTNGWDANEGFSDDAEWYFLRGEAAATPLTSYFVRLQQMPTRMAFGQEGAGEMFIFDRSRGE